MPIDSGCGYIMLIVVGNWILRSCCLVRDVETCGHGEL